MERMFSVSGLLYSGRRSGMFRSLEMRVCLKLNQRLLKENLLSTITVFQRLGLNVKDLCRNSLAEQT